MKAKGLFMFKSIQDRAQGSFINKETGEVIEYNACKILVCDEINEDNSIKERRFKIPEDNGNLVSDFQCLAPYTKVRIDFDVILYSSNAKVVPVSFEVE